MKPSEYLCTNFAFGHLATNVRVGSSDFFKVTCLCCIFEPTFAIRPPSCFAQITTDMSGVESFEEMVGAREAAAVATESGGDETATRLGTRPAVPGTRPTTRRQRRLMTNEMATTDGVMYTDEGELEFDEDELAALEGQRLRFSCGI